MYQSNGVLANKNEIRSQTYNKLHRWAGGGMTHMDLDHVYCNRDGKPLAIVETKHFNEKPMSDQQRKCLLGFGAAANVPVYVVYHDPDCTEFVVSGLNQDAQDRLNGHDHKHDRTRLYWWIRQFSGYPADASGLQAFNDFKEVEPAVCLCRGLPAAEVLAAKKESAETIKEKKDQFEETMAKLDFSWL